MTGQTQRPPAPGTFPPVGRDVIEQGLRLGESGRLCGEWDRWFTVQLDTRNSLRFQVLARGIKAMQFVQHLTSAAGRVTRSNDKLAETWLDAPGEHWQRAVAILEAAPELGPRIDTRGD